MKDIFNKLINSFDNNTDGFSARKLTAFSLMVCIAYIHLKFIDTTIAIEALIIDLCGVLVVLGIVTAEQVIKLKNGNNQDDTNK
jgi:hypothetical protein